MRKQAVLSVLAALALSGPALAMSDMPYHGEGHIMLNATELEWKPIASMAPGARFALIEGNLAEPKPFTFRLRLPADYVIAPHIHPAYERVTVLSGTFYFGHGREFDREQAMALEQGGFAIMAPGEPMYGYTTEPTVIQLHGTGPWGIEYLDPADDPRKQ